MNQNDTAVLDTIREAVGNTAVGKVFGEPVTRDGITIVPVAKVSGGGGGGGGEGGPGKTGTDREMKGSGTGGGFGLSAKPAGAFIIQNGSVKWRPAVDVNKVIIGGQVVAVVAILAVRAIIKVSSQRAEPRRRPSRRF
jgi:uncharacterized spore protein YtfJ